MPPERWGSGIPLPARGYVRIAESGYETVTGRGTGLSSRDWTGKVNVIRDAISGAENRIPGSDRYIGR